jgi:hypothetical protein
VGDGRGGFDVYSATTIDPTTPAFSWFEDHPRVAQKTDHNVPRSFGIGDQPWLLVNWVLSTP